MKTYSQQGTVPSNKSKSPIALIAFILFLCVWLTLFYTVFFGNATAPGQLMNIKGIDLSGNAAKQKLRSSDKTLKFPRRYMKAEEITDPPTVQETKTNLTSYLHKLHSRLNAMAGPTVDALMVWDAYLDVTKNMVMAWDLGNRHRHPKMRDDGSIFVSLGTYRDPYCPMTIKSLFSQAKHPEKLFIGLLQQNCFEKKCRTGVLDGGKVEDMGPDVNCYDEFCKSPEGQASKACGTDQIRVFNVNESESLGPYMARYLTGKFYRGENYYLQIDSHSEFTKDWDAKLIKMMNDAPAEKPVMSTYPPDSGHGWRDTPGFRMCDSTFAPSPIEWHIIRLASSMPYENIAPKIPVYAPFVAAGFIFTYGTVLHDVPFDPFLPWIFMGEEISMSARMWTAGYDIFSPTINVLNHYYVRRHYPKFWESVNRFFKNPIHNDLVELVIKRVKTMLGYPECTPEMVSPASLLYRLEDWSMGNKRSFATYLDMVGIEPLTKTITPNFWCHQAKWPPQAEPYRLTDK
eukprot:gene653-1265_t